MNKYQEALQKLRTLERQSNFERCLDIAPQLKCDVLQELVDLVKDERTIEMLKELKRQKENCKEISTKRYGWHTQRTGQKSTQTILTLETEVIDNVY